MKKALVCGAGGFIGHHMVRELNKKMESKFLKHESKEFLQQNYKL